MGTSVEAARPTREYLDGARRVAYVAFLLILCLGLFLGLASPAAAFSDVSPGDWAYEAIEELSRRGVVGGFGDGTFGPDRAVTRAQFTAMLARILEVAPAQSEPFRDVDTGDWFFPHVAALYGAGIVSGTDPDRFSPEAFVSRQQTASLIMRGLAAALSSGTHPMMRVEGEGAQPEDTGTLGTPSLVLSAAEVESWLQGFSDREYIADPHRAAVANGYRFNIITGTEDARFYPFLDITRAQAAAMLYRAFYQELVPRPDYPAIVGTAPYPTLRQGSEGRVVRWLETRLTALGYHVGVVDELFDYRTRDAVMAFQKVEWLERTGTAGSQVWRRIMTAGTPRLRYSGSRWVEVDLSRQVLFLARNGVLDRIAPISSGASGMRTPTGSTRIQRKAYGWQHGRLGSMYSPSFFRAHHAIHGSSSVPGWPASHGCVRTPVWMTDYLYWQMPIGTPVHVYY
jgi:hypothetical protein